MMHTPLLRSTPAIFISAVVLAATAATVNAQIVYEGNTTDKSSTGGKIFIGRNSPGSLTITGAYSVTAPDEVLIGQNATGSGTVLVTDTGATFQANALLAIGNYGSGAFTVANGGTLTLDFDSNFTLGRYAGSSGSLTVTGVDSASTPSSFNGGRLFIVGELGDGTVTVSDGAVLNAFHADATPAALTVAQNAGTTGVINVTSGATFNASTGANIGQNGTGTLNVNSGGTVDIDGVITFGSAASAQGFLNLDSGTVEASDNIYLGSLGYAEANLTGTALLQTTSALHVGGTAGGVFNASDDAQIVVSGRFDIGRGSGSVGTVNLSGNASVTAQNVALTYGAANATAAVSLTDFASLTATADIVVGSQGVATMTASGSSSINADRLFVGALAGSDGTMTISGDATLYVTGFITVGQYAKGVLNVENGGTVTAGNLIVGTEANDDGSISDGSVIINSGGQVDVAGDLRMSYEGVAFVEVLDGGSRLSVVGSNIVAAGHTSGPATATLHVGRGGLAEFGGSGLGYAFGSEDQATQRFTIGDDGTGAIASGLITTTGLVFGPGTATFDLTVDPGTSLLMGDRFTLIDYLTWDGNTFSNVADDSILSSGGYDFRINYNDAIGADDFAFTATVVPEPGETAVVLIGFLVVTTILARRRNASRG